MLHKHGITCGDKPYTIYTYDVLDSTNTFLKQHISDFPDFSVVWAQNQTGGRGRFDRKWSSAEGKDLTFSVVVPLKNLKKQLWQNIPQITACAISDILLDHGLENLIKWPNDILVKEKKICGILCETIEAEKSWYAVLGVGLNVNSTRDDLMRVGLPATSLCAELNRTILRDDLIAGLVDRILVYFNELCTLGFSSFQKRLKQRLAWLNEQKTVVDGNHTYTGFIADINPDGTLLFRCNDGTSKTLCSGEISFGQTEKR